MRRLPAVAAVLLLAGCEISEVTIAPADDVLVAEAVLRAGAAQQFVLLHRSLNGRVVRGEPGAEVALRAVGGGETTLEQLPLFACAGRLSPEATDSLTVEATCYGTPSTTSFRVRPGRTYELEVASAKGERLRGRTQVPGAFALRLPARGGTCRLPPETNLPLVWSGSAGAWSYIASLDVDGLGRALESRGIPARDRQELTAVSISERDTTLVLPAEFGLFEATDLDPKLAAYLQTGLPAGVFARLVLAAADRNYVNAIRGGSFNPSGTERFSSVSGDGVGVFGSVVTDSLTLVVSPYGGFIYDDVPPCLPGDPGVTSRSRR